MADGYGIGLFDPKGPTAFAESIKSISSALSGVGSGFTDFASKAQSSISGINDAIDKLISKLQGLTTSVANAGGATMGGGGGGGGGAGNWSRPSAPGGGGGSGGTGDTTTAGGWTMGDAPWPNSGTGDAGVYMQPPGTTESSKPSWMDRFFPKQQTGSTNGAPTSQTGAQGNGAPMNFSTIQRAAQSFPAAAAGAAANLIAGSGGSLVSNAIQGASIGQMAATAFGVNPKSMYVIPPGPPGTTLAQSNTDFAQANYYAMMNMGAAPGTANWSTVQRGANQLMTLVPGMSRQESMVTQNQMQQPNVLAAGVGMGINLRPGGKMLDPQAQYQQIFNALWRGGPPSAATFEAAMAPGGPGAADLENMGYQPGSDEWLGFMQYAQTRIGLGTQGKKMPSDIGTPAGAKAAGLQTPAKSQLDYQSQKAAVQTQAEPALATAAQKLDDAGAKLISAADAQVKAAGGSKGGIVGQAGRDTLGKIPGLNSISDQNINRWIKDIPGLNLFSDKNLSKLANPAGAAPSTSKANSAINNFFSGLVKDVGSFIGGSAASAQTLTSPTNTTGTSAVNANTTAAYSWTYASAPSGPIDLIVQPASTKNGSSSSSSSSSSTSSSSSSASTPDPSQLPTSGGGTPAQNQALGQKMALAYGWSGSQFDDLVKLWNAESGWQTLAKNASSGAYGIPQSLPANKMAAAGADYLTNPATQIKWGLDYIKGRYGNPAGAWAHEQQYNWYARGSQLIDRTQLAMLHRGEAVVPAADNYSTTPYNRNGAMGNGAPIVHLNFKPGSITLQVPPGSTQQDMDTVAQQFVAAIAKPQILASVRSK